MNILLVLVGCYNMALLPFIDTLEEILCTAMTLYPNYFVKLITYITGNRTKIITIMEATHWYTFSNGIFTPKCDCNCYLRLTMTIIMTITAIILTGVVYWFEPDMARIIIIFLFMFVQSVRS